MDQGGPPGSSPTGAEGDQSSPARPVSRGPIVAAALMLSSLLAFSVRWWPSPSWRLPMVQALYPVLAAGLSLVLVVATLWLLLRRRRAAAALLGLPLLVPLLLTAGTFGSDTVAAGPRDEVVMAANLQFGQADPRAVVAAARGQDAAVLVLVEITPDARDGLRRAGLETLFPYHVGVPRSGATGTMIFSRHPVSEVTVTGAARGFAQQAARVRAPGGPYLVRAVHTYPPTGGLGARWAEQLGELERWQRAQPADEPLVMAGDFNASSSHPAFRRTADGMTDALPATGAGWVRTWPREERVPPFVAIDHVLVRGLKVVDAGTLRVPGSDHDGVWARVQR